jgi:hypothetical protein
VFNRFFVADKQQQNAAARLVLPAGQRRRKTLSFPPMRVFLTLLTLLVYPILCAGIRAAGGGIVLFWYAMVSSPRLFVHVEERQVATLRGWGKFLVVLPLLVVGLLVIAYPRESACFGGIHVEGC